MVLALTLVAEKISPAWAGIISGLPTGTAISLFFFGLEVSPMYAAESALYNLLGLTASLSFIYFYYIFSHYISKYSLLIASISGIFGFLIVAFILSLKHFSVFGSVAIPFIVNLGLFLVFKTIPNTTIKDKIKLKIPILLMRVFVSSLLIVLITFIPRIAGPEWAGLFSAFPSTLFPLLVIIHFNYGKEHTHTIIKNMPKGMFSLIAYSFTVSLLYAKIGIYWGTLCAYSLAFGLLIIIQKVECVFTKNAFNKKE